MSKLTSGERKRLPKSDFGLPGKVDKGGKNEAGRGAYPMPDKAHARVAKSYAAKEANAGKLSVSAKEKIDAKADKILGETRRPKVEGHSGDTKTKTWNARREARFQRERGRR